MTYQIHLEPETSLFYTRLAEHSGLPTEQVLADALFKLAAELSLQALHRAGQS